MTTFYAVARGRICGIYNDWKVTESQVKGYPGSLHKSFKNKTDAQKYLIDNGIFMNKIDIPEISNRDEITERKSTNREKEIIDISDDFGDLLNTSLNNQINNSLLIYTDGSYSKGVGGIGIVCISGDIIIQKYSQKVNEINTTNIRAELYAIAEALNIIERTYNHCTNFTIRSASEYSVKVFNTWIHFWIQNGWKNYAGKTPENLDIIRRIHDHLFILKNSNKNIRIEWVRAHSTDNYNKLADSLANMGRLQ